MSAWSGIRPLVLNPNVESTESLARNHVLHISKSNLITIAGNFQINQYIYLLLCDMI